VCESSASTKKEVTQVKHVIALLLSAFSFQFSAHAEQTSDFQSAPVRLACGYSADVWMNVSAVIGKDISDKKESIPALGDESARTYVSLEDGSWFIAVEYFSQNSPKNNFTCITDKGSKESAIDAVTKPVTELPKEFIASPIRSPKEA
jgi:hypothetical protein